MVDGEQRRDLRDLDAGAAQRADGVHRGAAVGELVLDDQRAITGAEAVDVVRRPEVRLRLLEGNPVRQVEREPRGEDDRAAPARPNA